MPLKLQTRIGLGYGLAIATMALVMILVLVFFQASRHESALIRLEAIPSIEAANNLLLEVERMENAEFRYFVDPGARRTLMARFDANVEAFQANYDRLAALARTPEERRLLAEMGRHMGGLLHIDRRMRALIADGRISEAQALNRGESLDQSNQLRESARRFRDMNQRAIVISQRREDRYLLLTEALAALVVLLGVALAALTWWRTSRDIVEPLVMIEAGFEALVAGGAPRVTHPRAAETLEIERLQEGFNRLVESLTSARADLREASVNLESQVAERTEALSRANVRLERNIEELRALDALKSNFMAVVSHELLTPINFITGYGSALDDEVMGPLNEGQHKAIGRMLEGAQRLTRMVRNVLETTQLEAGELAIAPEPTAPGPILTAAAEAARPQAEAKRQVFEVTVPAALPEVCADGGRLEQALVELLDNAVKFTAEGGRIRLSASAGAGALEIVVSDSGVGIAPEAIPSLFDRFYQADSSRTRRHSGLGLGLAIAHNLITRMGGRIEVISRLGEGATFKVALPLASAGEQGRLAGKRREASEEE